MGLCIRRCSHSPFDEESGIVNRESKPMARIHDLACRLNPPYYKCCVTIITVTLRRIQQSRRVTAAPDKMTTIGPPEHHDIKTNILIFLVGLVAVYVSTKLDLYFANMAPAGVSSILRRLYVPLSLILYVYLVLVEPWIKQIIRPWWAVCPFYVHNDYLAYRSTNAIKAVLGRGQLLLRTLSTVSTWWRRRESEMLEKLLRLAVVAGVALCFRAW